jgi:hypothetical protein
MEMPKPTPAHEKLRALEGSWSGAEILHPSPWSPEARAATGTFENRVALDGFFLVNEYTESRDGAVVFRGHGVYGWDPKRERYTMHWFDTMGFPPNETLGTWEGDTLTFENRGPQGQNRYVYVVRDTDHLEFRIEHSRDGSEWQRFMEGTYERVRGSK